ncbi:IS3 family transposase [Actinoalloteichus caeruleus]|uniref:IS3 family transposase n=1 Tax=Actinoalloteichus cyanogriseus TaxID=2893586 RepID=UPI003BB8DB66
MEVSCRTVGLSVSTYYAIRNRRTNPSARHRRDRELVTVIRRIWEDSHRLYGARKIWAALHRQGVTVARCTVERLMRSEAMTGLVTRSRRPRSMLPGQVEGQPGDLVERVFRAPRPNRLWVTDLTYVRLGESRFVYSALVVDAFSRAIVGWQVSDTADTSLALDALDMALWARRSRLSPGLVAHSDRGVQYTALRYSQRLSRSGIARSVGRRGDSYDNALAESVNALYKKELIYRKGPWKGVADVRAATAEWIHWYNHHRLHSWCGNRPPLEYEERHWRQATAV